MALKRLFAINSFFFSNHIVVLLSVFLYGNYGVGLYDSTKPDVNQSVRGTSIQRRGSGRRGSGRRNHVCPKCGNGYTVMKSLKRHLRYECGLTPRFKCPYCGTRSKQRGHVSQHIRRKHSGQRVYIIDSPWWGFVHFFSMFLPHFMMCTLIALFSCFEMISSKSMRQCCM